MWGRSLVLESDERFVWNRDRVVGFRGFSDVGFRGGGDELVRIE